MVNFKDLSEEDKKRYAQIAGMASKIYVHNAQVLQKLSLSDMFLMGFIAGAHSPDVPKLEEIQRQL
jgi:hypothetical protein